MRATTSALVACLTLGCVPPTDGGAERARAELGLELRPVEVEGGWQLELLNERAEPVSLGCENGYCDVPTVRYEAQQADGSWVERASYARYERALNGPSAIGPRAAALLGEGDITFTDLDRAPGTYRTVVHTGEGEEVGLEFVVVGWSSETLRDARGIRQRAEIAECRGVTREIDQALIRNLEPDPLIDLHESTTDYRRFSVRQAMLERGGFVVFLGEQLAIGPMDEVREVAEWLSTRADPIQEPLRRVASERLADPVFGDGTVLASDYVLLHGLEGHWPDGTAVRLVERLENGLDVDESLIGLLDVLGFTWGPQFDDLGPRILAALPAHCDDATDEELVAACARVAAVYDPNTWVGYGMGLGGSSSCGIGWAEATPVCNAIRTEWETLSREAGELELVWLTRG